jgi:hypothetical protein
MFSLSCVRVSCLDDDLGTMCAARKNDLDNLEVLFGVFGEILLYLAEQS